MTQTSASLYSRLRRWLAPLALLAAAALQPAVAQQQPQFQAINPPIATDSGNKIGTGARWAHLGHGAVP